ncbi:MAG TPA: hypothetical protein VF933_35515, partial [Streptosporangiaceae bacterium]
LRTFHGLAWGFLAQTGKRTVCAMLAGAGLSRAWSHDRAHRFFARARWSPGELGLAAAKLVVALPGRGIRVVADSAYAGGELKKLPMRVTWTTRLRKDAALYGLPPARTGRRGRPRQKGDRLPPGRARGHDGAHPGHRHPLRHDRRRARRHGDLPVARGLRHQAGHRRAHPRQLQDPPPGPGYHRYRCVPRAGHRTVRITVVHRDRPPLVPVKLRCFLMAVFLVSGRVRVRAVPSGRGCRSLAGVPCVRVAAACSSSAVMIQFLVPGACRAAIQPR